MTPTLYVQSNLLRNHITSVSNVTVTDSGTAGGFWRTYASDATSTTDGRLLYNGGTLTVRLPDTLRLDKDGPVRRVELPDKSVIVINEDGSYEFQDRTYRSGDLHVLPGRDTRLTMPGGAVIEIDEHGNYRIDDKDHKTVYRAHVNRAFNRFINASDILEDFIHFAGRLGVTQTEFLKLPIELFAWFLIESAAKADGEESGIEWTHPALLPPPAPRCRWCGKFVNRQTAQAGLPFCGEDHMLIFARKRAVFGGA